MKLNTHLLRAAVAALGVLISSFSIAQPVTTRVSVSTSGAQASKPDLLNPATTPDGRFVVFEAPPRLLPQDTNTFSDIYLKDMDTGTLTLVSIGTDGSVGNGPSVKPGISDDGRYVVFESRASNFSDYDTNNSSDIFLRDVLLGTTTRVSVTSDLLPAVAGNFNPAISGNGLFVVYDSYADNLVPGDYNVAQDVFMYTVATGETKRISTKSDGSEATGASYDPSINRVGTTVAFTSSAFDLVENDTNSVPDVFVKDIATGVVQRVSIGTDSAQGNDTSDSPSIDAEGDRIAFRSLASNFTSNDSVASPDVFVRSISASKTTLVSSTMSGLAGGGYASHISTDGNYVAFLSDGADLAQHGRAGATTVYLRDLVKQNTERVSLNVSDQRSEGWRFWSGPVVSENGLFVVFESDASDLVSGDTNGMGDIFRRKMSFGTNTRVAWAETSDGASGGGSYGSSIGTDGRWIVFDSDATNLVPKDLNHARDVFLRDTLNGTTTRVSVSDTEEEANDASSVNSAASVSADGRYVAFISGATNLIAGDTNGKIDVFVRDTVAGTTRRVSVDSSGRQANAASNGSSISADGRKVVFQSVASDLVVGDTNMRQDVFVHDLTTGETIRVSVANDGSQANGSSGSDGWGNAPAISADGRFVVFESTATNLVPNDTNGTRDIFIRDTANGTTRLVSVASNGAQGNAASSIPSVSAKGNLVAFQSYASNLTPNDTNASWDIFVRNLETGTTTRVSTSETGAEGNQGSYAPVISADGRWVAFTSWANNLVPGDTNDRGDIFLRDIVKGSLSLISATPEGAVGGSISGFDSIYNLRGIALSPDARHIAFQSWAPDLVADDTNNVVDIFVRGVLHNEFTVPEILNALRIAAGLLTADATQMARLNVVTDGASASVVDIADATAIARSSIGL